MARFAAVVLTIALGLPAALWAGPIELPADPARRPLLKSIYAGEHQLTDFLQNDTRAVVLVFMGTACPVAQQYVPRLSKMHEELKARGVKLLAIYSNSGDHVFSMARHAHDADIPFPVLLDAAGRLADLVHAKVTPEVVVLDAELNKRYQGAIDNQFKKRGQIQEPTEHYLKDALAQLLAGRKVEKDYAPPSGCPIERHAPPTLEREVTYHRDIAPLVQSHCQSCHRSGGVGPFELASYEDAYYNAEKILEAVSERRMPPWHGLLNPKFGKLHNDKRLKADEVRLLASWVEQGAREGDPQDAPPPVRWPQPSDWQIGTPDYVYKMPEPFKVPRHGVVEYQFFRVRLGLKQDRWFDAVEVKPGDATVVHHVALHVVPAGDEEYVGFTGMAKLYGLTAQEARLINDYVPGDTYSAKVYPPGRGVRIPKDCDLVFELHYTPNNRNEALDQSMVAFRWAKEAPREEVLTHVFRKPIGRFRIPPLDHHFKMEDSYYFEHDVEIDAIRAHFHLRGKSYRLEIVERDAETGEITGRETVLSIPAWDPDWQRTYELARPLRLPAGTELLATGHFDNSPLNPNNPDPSATVLWGQQSADEMFSTRFKFRIAKPLGE